MSYLTNIPLKLFCEEQKQPFVELATSYDLHLPIRKHHTVARSEAYRPGGMGLAFLRNTIPFGSNFLVNAEDIRSGTFLFQGHRSYEFSDFFRAHQSEIENVDAHVPTFNDQCVFLGGRQNFGHFVFELLYRLPAFEQVGLVNKLPIVVYDDMPKRYIEFIELYGVSRDSIVPIPASPAPVLNKAWHCSAPNHLTVDPRYNEKIMQIPNEGSIPREDRFYNYWFPGATQARAKLREASLKSHPKKGPRLVFIGRPDALHRRLLNEDELWATLEPIGFVKPDYLSMSAAEQIQSVRDANVIVSLSGAGSVITHFAPTSCHIIDIVTRPLPNGGMGSVLGAFVNGQSYERIVPYDSDFVHADLTERLDSDYTVDVGRITQALGL